MALALGLAACSGGSRVGSKDLLKFKQGQAGRLGAIESSPTPSAKATSSATTRSTATPAKSAKPSPVTRTWPVRITAQGFQPFNFNVFLGDVIEVVNQDGQPRSFTADDGSFDSGLLKPGAKWRYTATKLGTFNVSDSTRPFVVGKFTVLART